MIQTFLDFDPSIHSAANRFTPAPYADRALLASVLSARVLSEVHLAAGTHPGRTHMAYGRSGAVQPDGWEQDAVNVTKGIATRSKDATSSSWHRY